MRNLCSLGGSLKNEQNYQAEQASNHSTVVKGMRHSHPPMFMENVLLSIPTCLNFYLACLKCLLCTTTCLLCRVVVSPQWGAVVKGMKHCLSCPTKGAIWGHKPRLYSGPYLQLVPQAPKNKVLQKRGQLCCPEGLPIICRGRMLYLERRRDERQGR